jgi:hypothetical protein
LLLAKSVYLPVLIIYYFLLFSHVHIQFRFSNMKLVICHSAFVVRE